VRFEEERVMALRPEVRQAIEEVMRQQFDMVPITSIEVEEDEDFYGVPILRVRMIYDADVEDLDRERLIGITQQLRDRLWDLDEERFPHTAFISLSDMKQRRHKRRHKSEAA
jgi:hypothetical protein